jgi:phosphate transport system ATP-binding protein
MNATVSDSPTRSPGSTTGTPTPVEVESLQFHYGSFHALKDLNLRFAGTGATALIGPSGCGKSTFLRIFNRIYELYPGQHAEGAIRIDGENVLDPHTDLNELRTKVGMVFQRPTPFPMSIFENVAFAVRKVQRIGKRELADRVEWSLTKAGLWEEVKDTLKKPGSALSGGQQQRLCIARTIALQPSVLLLDEPTSALDPYSVQKVEALVEELKNEFKIIIVTHNMSQARRVSEETVFMVRGEVVEFAPTDQLFDSPREERTRAYLEVGDL